MMKNNEVIAEKNISERWRHQALVNAWPSWTDRSLSIHPSSLV